MSLQKWIDKYVTPIAVATTNDTAALEAFLLQLEGIYAVTGLQYAGSTKWKSRMKVWFRYGKQPRIVDKELNTFEFTFDTCPLCILHPQCITTRDCPLNLVRLQLECCFEPLSIESEGFPSPRLSLVKGDPLPMMALVRKAIRRRFDIGL